MFGFSRVKLLNKCHRRYARAVSRACATAARKAKSFRALPGATQRPGHQLPCTVASCDDEALRQRALCLARVRARTHPQRIAPRLHARTRARTRAHGRPTNERCDVQSAGVAVWNTARRGNTECTLTAVADPSPRDPYRHALAIRPLRKVRPFSFLNYSPENHRHYDLHCNHSSP